MKILIVSESYWPNLDGGAIAQRMLAHGLSKDGHDIEVWAPGKYYHSYQEKDGKILVYRERSFVVPQNKRYRFSLWPFWHGISIVRKVRPNIIHIHAPSEIGLAAIIAAKIYKIPIVITNHVMPENLISTKIPKIIYKIIDIIIWKYISWFHNCADYITAPSSIALDYLINHDIKKPKEVISNGIDLDFYRPSFYKERSSLQILQLLYVGRLDQEKNIDTLIKAVSIISKNIKVEFVIIGEGTQDRHLKSLCDKLLLTNIVIFRGRLSNEEKLKAYQQCDIFLIASPSELQSLATMEAMACAKPIIAANAGALPNLVSNDINGYLINTYDFEAFAQKCIELLKNDEKRQRFGQESINIIKNGHAFESSLKKYEAAYRQLL